MINRSYNKGKHRRCELHLCLRHVMMLCRWAGFFPVTDLWKRTDATMRLKFKSPYFYYYITTVAIQIIVTFFTFYWLITTELSLSTFSSAIFYLTSLITAVFLMRLAMNWPQLMKKALETERSLTMIRVTSNAPKIAVTATHVIMLLALTEHILSKIFNLRLVMICNGEMSLNKEVIRNYYLSRMPYVFNHTFDIWSAIYMEMASIQATFLWSFTDVLIICVSIYLTSYFHDLNKMIRLHHKKHISTWGQLRMYYSNLVVLTKEIDNQLKYFVLLSFFTNLFFICVQLFNSLSDIGLDYLMYYIFSFLFLVIRALMISMLAANIHAEAIKPTAVLYEVPASEFSVEVSRFLLQLRYNKTALSGLFFHVTKKMILRMFGTVMTYELVLLQFKSKSHRSD